MAEKRYQKFSETRHRQVALVVTRNRELGIQLRQALLSSGFGDAPTVGPYERGIEKLEEGGIDVVFFQAETPPGSSLDVFDFVKKFDELKLSVPLLALSEKPKGDHLFALMKAGAKGFLIPPVTPSAIEDAINQLQGGIVLSDEILNSEDRNQKFSELIQFEFDQYATFVKECSDNAELQEEVDKRRDTLKKVIDTARFFCEESEQALMEKLYQHNIKRAELLDQLHAKTDLAKTREMLRQKRKRHRTDK